MPSRERADHAAIAAVYEETGSGRETARRLSLHPNTVYQVLRMQRGKCRTCAEDAVTGGSYCPRCLERERSRVNRERKRRMREGLCMQCDKPHEKPSLLYCAKHRLAHLERGTKSDAKLRSRHVHGGIPAAEQRERGLRHNYGINAVEMWRELQGRCAMCGIEYRERSVHVHHMNRDKTDNRRDNLTLLCQRCHAGLHRMLLFDDPVRAFAWIREHYPELPL